MITTYKEWLNESENLGLLKTKEEVQNWLETHIKFFNDYKEAFVINDDLTIDVFPIDLPVSGGSMVRSFEIYIHGKMTKLPVQFGNTPGISSFNAIVVGLKTLEGFPKSGTTSYYLNYNKLENLLHLIFDGKSDYHNTMYARKNNLISVLTSDIVPIRHFTLSENPCSGEYNRHKFFSSGKEEEILQMHIDVLLVMAKKYKTKVLKFFRELKKVDSNLLDRLLAQDVRVKEFLMNVGELGQEVKQAYNYSKDVEGDFY